MNAKAADRPPLSTASRITVTGLAAAAVGVVVLLLAGTVFTTAIPPGLVILLVPAGLVVLGRWRWTLVAAALAGLFVSVGYFPSGSASGLVDPSPPGVFLGLWLQFAGALTAGVAGVAACLRAYRPSVKAGRHGEA